MTTIAYKEGTLAADSRETVDGWILPTQAVKIVALKDGSLFGAAGECDQCEQLLRSVKKRSKKVPKLNRCEGILIDKRGNIRRYEGTVWQQLKSPFYAIGSGNIPALVAMHLGKNAETAVKIAAEFDNSTGGTVRTLTIKGNRAEKKGRKGPSKKQHKPRR